MKIALLQLNSQIGHVEDNIAQATAILSSKAPEEQIDLLVLPELAFTGYNFPSLESIRPYLEPTAAGVSTNWAKDVAQRLKCHVIVGYPELSTEVDEHGNLLNYNATVTIGPDGQVLATYRKSFLYYTDESWAAEGPGFFDGNIGTLGHITHGICMDINPKEFTAPWDAYEFATHCLASKAKLIVLSTAWLTHSSLEVLQATPTVPDISTLSYWIERFEPLMNLSEITEPHIVVFANRCGSEIHQASTIHTKNGKIIELGETHANYAGSSCVMRFVAGRVSIYDVLGQYNVGLLVVDTAEEPKLLLCPGVQEDKVGVDTWI